MRLPRRHFLHAGLITTASLAARGTLSAELPPPRFRQEIGGKGTAPGKFDAPVGLAIDAKDQIYVTDFRNQRLQKFAPDGALLGAYPVEKHPGGIAVAPDGVVYIAHWNTNWVGVYSPKGELIHRFGETGTGEGQFRLPGGVAVSAAGEIFVCDQGNSRIQVFGDDFKFRRAFGSHGEGPGQFGQGVQPGSRFAGPQFVALDAKGDVYATDTTGSRVQRFTTEGRLVSMWSHKHEGPGGFLAPNPAANAATVQGPIALQVDRDGCVWVSATNHLVQQFDAEGRLLRAVGGHGETPGRFHVPHSMVLDSEGNLIVVDTGNDRLQKFQLK